MLFRLYPKNMFHLKIFILVSLSGTSLFPTLAVADISHTKLAKLPNDVDQALGDVAGKLA